MNSSFKNFLKSEEMSFLLFITLPIVFMLWKGQTVFAIIWGLMLLPILTFKIRSKNIFTIMIVYFILEPISLFLFFGILLAMITRSQSDLLFVLYVLLAIPIITIFHLLLDLRNYAFLTKAKVALEYNNAIFVIGAAFSVIYAYSATDFSYLKPMINFEGILNDGFQARDAFSYIFAVFSFPFLVSMALSKAIVEHRLYKIEEQEKRIMSR